MDFSELPRQLTWPAGFAIILAVLTLVALPMRRRSTLSNAVFSQLITGTIVMIAIVALIAFTLAPADVLPKIHH